MTEPTKFDVGGVWEDSEWRVEYDHEVYHPYDQKRCPHATCLAPSPTGWIIPRVVVATNEGGYDSTGVCLDCILDAAKTL